MNMIEHRAECQDGQSHSTYDNADESEEYKQIFQPVKNTEAIDPFDEYMPCFHVWSFNSISLPAYRLVSAKILIKSQPDKLDNNGVALLYKCLIISILNNQAVSISGPSYCLIVRL